MTQTNQEWSWTLFTVFVVISMIATVMLGNFLVRLVLGVA